jgi:hypothetical protein
MSDLKGKLNKDIPPTWGIMLIISLLCEFVCWRMLNLAFQYHHLPLDGILTGIFLGSLGIILMYKIYTLEVRIFFDDRIEFKYLLGKSIYIFFYKDLECWFVLGSKNEG